MLIITIICIYFYKNFAFNVTLFSMKCNLFIFRIEIVHSLIIIENFPLIFREFNLKRNLFCRLLCLIHIYIIKIANTFECLFARVFFCTFGTRFTMHAAAPMKFASALPRSCKLMCIITASTAHQITSIST